MKSCDEWKPFTAMIAIDFVFAIVNILLKKVLDEGMDPLVLVTFRLSIATIFLAPIGYFWERYCTNLHLVYFLPYFSNFLSIFTKHAYSFMHD